MISILEIEAWNRSNIKNKQTFAEPKKNSLATAAIHLLSLNKKKV